MPNNLELLIEANKRGILPPDKKTLFAEAEKRGLISSAGVNSFENLPGDRLEQDYPTKRVISNAARSTLEMGGLVGGSILGAGGGTVAAPGAGTVVGGLAGAALGHGIGGSAADRLDEFLGLVKKKGLKESSIKALSDMEKGAMLEMGGGVIGKGLTVAGKGIWSVAEKHGILDFFKRIKNMFPAMSDAGILKKSQDVLKTIREETPRTIATATKTEELLKSANIKTVPTYAQKTGSTTAGYFEQSAAAQNRELASILKQQDAKINQEALENIGAKFQDKGTVGDVLRSVENQKQQLAKKAQETASIVEQQTAQLANVKDPQVVGQAIKETLDFTKQAEKKAINEIYEKIPQGIELSAKPIQKSMGEVIADFKKIGGGSPTFPVSILKQMKSALNETKRGIKGSSVTMAQLRDWRSQIGEEIRDSMMGASPNLKLTRRLKKLQDGVDENLDQMLELSPEYASTIELYRTASTRFKDYINTFRKGTVGDVLQPGNLSGGGKINLSDIPSRFFRTGKLDAADDLIRAAGKDKATNLIDDYAGYDLLSRTKGSATLKTSTSSEWLFRNKEVLKKYGLYDKYANMVKTGEGADVALAELNAYEKSIAGRILGTNIDSVIPKLFGGTNKANSAKSAKDLLNIPGIKDNIAATNGIKNGFKDFFLASIQTSKKDALGNEISSIAKAKAFLQDYKPAMLELYKDAPEKMGSLIRYHQLLDVLERNKNITFAGGSTTAEKLAGTRQDITSGIVTNIAQFIAVERGAGWKFSVFRNLWKSFTSGPRKFSEAQIDALLTEAIYNPEVAQTIMEATNPFNKSTIKLQNKFKKHLLTMGAYTINKGINEAKEEFRNP